MANKDGVRGVRLMIPTDLYECVQDEARAISKTNSYVSATSLMVKAIADAMEAAPEDKRLSAIESSYGKLPEAGKDWLATAATLAAKGCVVFDSE